MRFRLVVDGEVHQVELERGKDGVLVRIEGAEYRARVRAHPEHVEVRLGSTRHRIEFRGVDVFVDGRPHGVVVHDEASGREPLARERDIPKGLFEIRPPMPGRVVRVAVGPGTRVKRGQAIVVLEAMKMQNEIPAPVDAVVRVVHVREGESIGADRLIAVLEAV